MYELALASSVQKFECCTPRCHLVLLITPKLWCGPCTTLLHGALAKFITVAHLILICPSGVRCCVVALANSIDITERCLPALKCRGCAPEFIPFTAYARPQVSLPQHV